MKAFIIVLMMLMSSVVQASTKLRLTQQESQLIDVNQTIKDVFISDGSKVGAHSPSSKHVLLMGKQLGSSDVVIIGQNGKTLAHYRVEVVADLQPLEVLSQRRFPITPLIFEMSGHSIMVKGEVEDPLQAHSILTMVQSYAQSMQIKDSENEPPIEQDFEQGEKSSVPSGGEGQYPNVINQLTLAGSDQVNISIRIVEMERSTSEQLGVRWSAIGKHFQLGVSPINRAPDILPAGTPWPFSNDAYFDPVIDALVENNLVTILAEPNLTAKSGEAASFMSGGEFPIPVSAGDEGEIQIEFKKFGIALDLTPTLLSNNRISLTVAPEVSSLNKANGINMKGLVVPGLDVRRTSTTVELANGQSFVLAGLINSYSDQNSEGLPVLGEIPGIAPFFSSTRYRKAEKELIIIATARLVQPSSNPLDISTPLDNFQAPNRLQRLFLGEFGHSDIDQAQPKGGPVRLFGQYGYNY